MFIVPTSTVLVLVNALYFKSNWINRFRTSDMQKFYITSENSVDVDMMSITKNFSYKHDPHLGAKILEIPYEVNK